MTTDRTGPGAIHGSGEVAASIEAALSVRTSGRHRAAVAARAAQVVRPPGALRHLDDVAAWLAGWQRTDRPTVERPAAIVFGADHGVASRGVSAYPADVTRAMAEAIDRGEATCNAVAAAVGASIGFVDVGVGRPTGDLAVVDALDPDRFAAAWRAGAEAVADRAAEADLLVLGELGIGNTTAASAIAAATLGGPVESWVGRGTGIDDEGLARKREAVSAALDRLPAGGGPPLEILRRVGGAELVALAGATVEARRRSIPLLLDGFIATAAVIPLAEHRPGMLDHCRAGHRSAEVGHGRLLEALGLSPLLELDLRLGEASGALVAVPLVRAAVAAVVDVATFAEIGLGGPAADDRRVDDAGRRRR